MDFIFTSDSLSIYRGNYSGKKNLKQSKKTIMCHLYQQNYQIKTK
jgi:ABC-type uncharacterized transport system substrate-binding protein